ncbi:uncharacterized protein [Diabrotica undecimpunctata]|uniref:uncharacterized protein n=2 Tax=Diabrotica undecimpunctata TaxID=50387 RepID=UPI003B6326D0
MALKNSRKNNSVISGQSREIIFNVFNYFKNIKLEAETLKTVKENTAKATGISIRTIERITSEAKCSLKNTGRVHFSSPGKKRVSRSIIDLPEYQISDIRRIIYDFYKTEKCRVTVKKLKQKIHNDLDITISQTSLRRLLRKMQFRWRKTENNRKVLVEKSAIRALRIKYLRQIKYFRSQNRPIVYVDETYLHSGHTSSKNWTDESTKGLFSNISKGQRLIIVHAGGDMGFIKNGLLIFKSGSKSGAYHSEMNSDNYGKWLQEHLLPNLPANSVLVFDNAPYHSIQLERAPTSNSNKNQMIEWLMQKNISFTPSALKPELYEIIKYHKPHHVKYKFDEILRAHGHIPLRLPPYHPDLNPIELIWATVKNNIRQKNVTFKLTDVQKLAEEEFTNIDANEWRKRCYHVIKKEDEYMDSEIVADNATQIAPIIINLDSDSSSTEFSSSEDEDEENY